MLVKQFIQFGISSHTYFIEFVINMFKFFIFVAICILPIHNTEAAVPIDIVTESGTNNKAAGSEIVLMIPDKQPLISRSRPDDDSPAQGQKAIIQSSNMTDHQCDDGQCKVTQ